MSNPTWNGGSDNWTTAADWSTGQEPGAGDNVTINQGNPQITSNVGTVASVADTSALSVVDGSLATTGAFSNSGLLNVDQGGQGGSAVTIGGTLTNSGTTNIGSGNLQNATAVTVGGFNNTGGTLNLTGAAAQATLDVTSGTAGFGTAGEVVGNVNLQGAALIEFASGQINDVVGNLALVGSQSRIADASNLASNSALAGLTTIEGTLYIQGDALTTTGALANSGTLDIDNSYDYGDGHYGGSAVTIGGTLTNSGTTNIGSGNLQNATAVTVGGFNNTGGTLNLTGAAAQATLDVTSGTAGFGTAGEVVGNVNLQGAVLIEFASGQINDVAGNLALVGSQSRIADASNLASNSALAGLTTIEGTLYIQGDALTTTGALANSGTLDIDNSYDYGDGHYGGSAVTIGGTLTNSGTTNIGSGNLQNATAVTVGGFNNTGGTLNLTGAAAQATLDVTSGTAGFGTAGEVVGNVNLQGAVLIEFASGQINDVAGNLALVGSQSRIADASNLASNSALAGLTTIEGTLYIQGDALTTTGALTNSGSLDIDNSYDYGDGHYGGSAVTIGGTLTNSGTTNIGSGNLQNATAVTVGGFNNTGGTLNLTGAAAQATLDVTSGTAGFGTAGEVVGNVNLQGAVLIEFASGQINDVVGNLALVGSQSRIADASNLASNSALAGLTTIEGTLYIQGDALTTTGALANSGTLDIDNSYDYGDGHYGGSAVTIGGTLTNSGTTNIGSGNLQNATAVTVGGFNNTGGTLNLTGAAAQATLDVTSGTAGFGTAGEVVGNVNLQGAALIEFASGQINDVVGNLALVGSQSRIADASNLASNSALAGLTTIEGTLYIQGDALTTTGALANSGTLDIDNSYDYGDGHYGGSTVTIGGTLTNSGTTNIGSGNLQNATTVTVGGINNTGGNLNVSGSANVQTALDVTGGAAGFGTPGELVGNVFVYGDALVEFASGQITDVVGSLVLDGAGARIADAGSLAGNSALAGLTTIGGTLDIRDEALATTGALTNSGTLNIDSNRDDVDIQWGGSTVNIGGTLTNSGTTNIGDGNLQNATTVTVGGINNTGGNLNVSGGPNAQTTLDVTGGAGFGTSGELLGNVFVYGDALVEFASGQITDIVGSLVLDDTGARIADAGNLAGNSALAGLTTIGGTLDIRGDNLTTDTGLTNSGTLNIDFNRDDVDNQWGGSTVNIGGTLTNTGTVNIGLPYYAGLQNATSVTVKGLNNLGGNLTVGGGVNVQATLDVTGGTAGFGTSGELLGNVLVERDALIEFASGQISDIVGSLVLDGAGARIADAGNLAGNSALADLTTIGGTLDIRGDALTTTAGLTNSGAFDIDSAGDDENGQRGGSTVNIGGTLTNTGTINIGDPYNVSQNATSVTMAGFNNLGGTLNVSGGPNAVATFNVTGVAENNAGSINLNNNNSVMNVNGTFEQGTSGTLTLEVQGTAAGQYATIATSGNVDLTGGALNANVQNLTLAAGDSFNLMTFTPGELSGIFNNVAFGFVSGDGTTVNLGNGLTAGLVYADSAGALELEVVATPTSTADTWTAGASNWSAAADWTNGGPTFYSDVTIGSASAANVTLSNDATINSLTINASEKLTTSAGTDLSIGSTLSVAAGATLNVGGEAFADGAVSNAGSIIAAGSLLDLRGAITGGGSFTVQGGATLELGASDAETVNFSGASATLKLDVPALFSGTLASLAVGDTIDLVNTVVASATVSGTTLTVVDNNNNTLTFNLAQFPAGAGFKVQGDGAGGSNLVVIPPVTTVTINAIDGNDIINNAEAHAAGGITLSGSVTGLSQGATFSVVVSDGAFSKTYTATVGSNGTWTATMPSADAITLPNGAASFTAAVNASTQATQSVTIAETLPTVTIAMVDGNDVINYAEAHAAGGVPLTGTVTGLASGATFNVLVTDGTFSKTYTATVGTSGAWTATIPSADAVTLGNGTATVSAQVTDAYGNQSTTATQSVTIAETLPTVTIAMVDGNDVINYAEAHAAGGVPLTGTVTGLASGATFNVKVTDGTFSKTYAATVASGGTWTATIPSADAITLGNGTATVSAQVTDTYGNQSTVATQSVTVSGNIPVVTINAIDGNDVINYAEAHGAGGVPLTGTVTGLASGATFNVLVTDGTFSKTYAATVASGGTWTATIPSADAITLGNGTATVSAQVTDAYGNQSTTATQSVTIAETLPTVTIAMVDGNDVINYAEAHGAGGVPLTGTVTGLASGATFNVKVTDGSFSKTYTATVGTSGAWTATIPSADAVTLGNGTATVSAQVTDTYGNQSTVATQSVTVSGNIPVVTINAIDGNDVINYAEAHGAGGVPLTGTVTGLASGATFNVKVTDGSFSKTYTATVGTSGAWTATIPSADAVTLGNGTATVSAQVTDAYGNQSTTATQSVTIAETLPTVTIAMVDGNDVINYAEAHAAGGVPLTGTVTGLASGATFNVLVTDGSFSKTYTATVGTSGAWTATIPSADAVTLGNGTATVSAQVTDTYGNQSTVATQSVTIAETLPTVTIAMVDGNDVINYAEAHAAGGVPLTGTVTGLASGATFNVKVTDGSFSKTYTATVGTSGAWTATIPFADAVTLGNGTATVSAQVTDTYGNQSTVATQSVTIAETLPTVTIAMVDGNDVINYAEAHAAGGVPLTGTVTGLASGATFNVKVTDGSFSKTYTATVGTSGAWTATIPSADAVTLGNGTATVSAQVTDTYGNQSTVATQSVTIAETLPTVTIAMVDGNDVINYAEAHAAGGVPLTGTVTGLASGATFNVLVTDGSFSKTYTATVGTSGAWTATIPSADAATLGNGTATVSAQVTGAYGNQSTVATQSVTVAENGALTINPVDGNNIINYAEANVSTGVALTGTVSGLAAGTKFGVSVVDGAFSKIYTATVAANGAWTATIPMTDAIALSDGSAHVTATLGAGQTATETVTVAETPPDITAVAESPSSGALEAGKTVMITLSASEAVIVMGSPTLSLNDGGVATYDAAKSTATKLVFDYTVLAGQNTATLMGAQVNLNGGSIDDSAANVADLSLIGLTQKGPTVDTRAPIFVGLAESPNAGDLGLGKTVTLTLATSEAVTVAGTPTLMLNDGGIATYDKAKSTSTSLVFTYTVTAGQSTQALTATGVNLSGGSIADLAGNSANLSLANITQVGPQIDGLAPKITAMAEMPSTGDLDAGKSVLLSLTTSEAVKVTGAPTLTLNDGGVATYDAALSTSSSLVFSYTVKAGQNTLDLQATAVNLNGGAINDPAGNATNLSLSGLVQTGPQIDTTPPKFTALSDTPATGDLDAGKNVLLTLTASEAVKVTGGPTLTLNDGGVATYNATLSTATSLVFSYTVAAGQNTSALKATAVNLNGGSVDDLAGNPATLSLSGLLQAGPQIDTTPPKFSAISEAPATGDLDVGKNVLLTLTTNEAVSAAGPLTLTLNDGGVATYDATLSTANKLVFSYTVAAGQNTSSLKATAVNLNGGSINDLAGNAAALSLTGLSQSGPQIDTTPPTITTITETPSTGDLDAGKSTSLTMKMSEAVTVTGSPTLTLNDGGIATYDAAKSATNKLVFDYTVAAAQNTPDLMATNVILAGGSINDLAGNTAVLSLSGLTQAGPKVDTTAPTVTGISGSLSGNATTGQTEIITVLMSEAVNVSGKPQLVLNDGGVATYTGGSGSNTLEFDYKVGAGQSTDNLTIVGVNLPSSQSVTDLAGNPMKLPNTAVSLGVSVNNSVTISASGDYQILGPSSEGVTFAPGASGTLVLTDSQQYTGQISGLTANDTLDLADIAFGSNTTVAYSGTSSQGTLSVSDGAHVAKISLLGNYLASTFVESSDGSGGTLIVDPPAPLHHGVLSSPRTA